MQAQVRAHTSESARTAARPGARPGVLGTTRKQTVTATSLAAQPTSCITYKARATGRVGVLGGIVAVSAWDIWAVGNGNGVSDAGQPLVEHWNGTSWTIVPSPRGDLWSVSALSARDIWAVGSTGTETLF